MLIKKVSDVSWPTWLPNLQIGQAHKELTSLLYRNLREGLDQTLEKELPHCDNIAFTTNVYLSFVSKLNQN